MRSPTGRTAACSGAGNVPLFAATLLLIATLAPAPAFAEGGNLEEDRREQSMKLFRQIHWQTGPGAASIANVARIALPDSFEFTDRKGADLWDQVNHNPPSHDDGVLLPPFSSNSEWFASFRYENSGYVRDTDADSIDADALLKNLTEATEESNKYRREKGWEELHLVGWSEPPHYETGTHRLTWGIRAQAHGQEVVNHFTRLLGRRGVMSVNLVTTPAELPAAARELDAVLAGFSYVEGQRYAEFRKGDKIAQYGLTALIAGGVGVAAVKSGLLGKFLKVIIAAVVAGGAALARGFRAVFRRDEQVPPPPQA